MANLGPIDLKIDLYIKINVKEGQKKFEVHNSEHLVKKIHQLAHNRPDITLACEH